MKTTAYTLYIAATLLCIIMLTGTDAQATTYYSRASGNWNASTTWSTVTYGDPTNTGSYPVIGDIVFIGDGHSVMIASASQCSGLTIGEGSSGELTYPAWGTLTVTVSGTLTINNGASLSYNGNNTRTHNLFVSGNIVNNGVMDLYSDANDGVNLVLNGAANAVISGTGSFAFNIVTISKGTRNYTVEIQSDAFLAAAAPGVTIPRMDILKGTIICNTGGSVVWSDAAATSVTIPMDVALEFRSGIVRMLTNGDTLINSGKIYITGGTLEVCSTAGLKGILNRDAGANNPEIEITAGSLICYGGIAAYPGVNPFTFIISGGIADLNGGTTGTDMIPLHIANTAGSQCLITGGSIYIRRPSTTAANADFDFGSSNVYHNVTDGHVYFGNGSTPFTFDYMPYVSYTYPHLEVAGAAGTLLRPRSNINSRMLSLKINAGNAFDMSSAGTNATSTQISLTSNLDGIYAFYSEGTLHERLGHFILSGTAPQTCYTGAGDYNIYNLTVNNPAGIFLEQPLTITGTLNLTAGVIFSDVVNILTIASGATVTGASNSSYVDGPVRKTGSVAFTFPTGENNMYRPISISAPAFDTDEFTAEYSYISPDPVYDRSSHAMTLDHISDTEFWTLLRSAGASTVNVTLSWNAASGGVDDLAALRVAQWDGSTWQDQGNGGTTGNTTAGTIVNSFASTSYGPFTLASATANNPLPVELVNFRVKALKGSNRLTWQTLSEKQNDYFDVERSFDGSRFQSIAKVDGAGTTSVLQNYAYDDRENFRKACYRLKQVDINGDFAYSEIKCIQAGPYVISVSPTIVSTGAVAITFEETGTNTFIQVYDVLGNLIYKEQAKDNPSFLQPEIFGRNGIYFITLVAESELVHSERLVVSR